MDPRLIQPKVKTVRPSSDSNSVMFKSGGGMEEVLQTWAATWQPVINREAYVSPSGKSTQRFSEYTLHPLVQLGISTLLTGAFSTGWSFVPGNDYKSKQGKIHEGLDNEIIESMYYQTDESFWDHETFEANLYSFVEYAMEYGFEVAERLPKHQGNFTGVCGLKTYEPFEFELYVDDHRDLERLQYSYSGQWFERDEINDHFVVGTWPRIKGGNLYGWSSIQPVLHDIKALQIIEEAQTLGVQSLVVKPIIHWYLANATDKREIESIRMMLTTHGALQALSLKSPQKVGENQIAGLAKAHEFEVLDDRASHDGVELIKDVIDFLQKRILRTYGLPDDLGFTTTSVGSLAKASEEMNLFLARIRQIQVWIEGIVNRHIVPWMVLYNWELPERYMLPKFRFNIPKEDKNAEKAAYLLDLFNAKIIDEHHVQEVLNLPEKTLEKAAEERSEIVPNNSEEPTPTPSPIPDTKIE